MVRRSLQQRPCAAHFGITSKTKHASVHFNRAAHSSLNRAVRRCRPPRSLPDAQEDMGRLLGGGMWRCLDKVEMQLAGTPLCALVFTPMDKDAQPSVIRKVRSWPSA
jgi:hypothetical protein